MGPGVATPLGSIEPVAAFVNTPNSIYVFIEGNYKGALIDSLFSPPPLLYTPHYGHEHTLPL